MGYIQIYISEKGFARIEQTTKEKIEKIVNNEDEFRKEDLAQFDKNGRIDCEYQDGKYIFIKGEVIDPKPVTKVTKYEID